MQMSAETVHMQVTDVGAEEEEKDKDRRCMAVGGGYLLGVVERELWRGPIAATIAAAMTRIR